MHASQITPSESFDIYICSIKKNTVLYLIMRVFCCGSNWFFIYCICSYTYLICVLLKPLLRDSSCYYVSGNPTLPSNHPDPYVSLNTFGNNFSNLRKRLFKTYFGTNFCTLVFFQTWSKPCLNFPNRFPKPKTYTT